MSAAGKNDDLEAQLDALVGDLKTLQADVRKLAQGASKEAGDRLSEALKTAEARASSAYAQARDRATEAVDQAEVWATDGMANLRDAVREEPIKAVAIAAGIGALFGLIFFRR
ncbi:MAG: glycine zipper domain-containing protein [Rhizomicrobium sp.]